MPVKFIDPKALRGISLIPTPVSAMTRQQLQTVFATGTAPLPTVMPPSGWAVGGAGTPAPAGVTPPAPPAAPADPSVPLYGGVGAALGLGGALALGPLGVALPVATATAAALGAAIGGLLGAGLAFLKGSAQTAVAAAGGK